MDRRVLGCDEDGSTQCQKSEKSEEMAASVCREAETQPRQPCFEHIFPLLAPLLMNLVNDTTETIYH